MIGLDRAWTVIRRVDQSSASCGHGRSTLSLCRNVTLRFSAHLLSAFGPCSGAATNQRRPNRAALASNIQGWHTSRASGFSLSLATCCWRQCVCICRGIRAPPHTSRPHIDSENASSLHRPAPALEVIAYETGINRMRRAFYRFEALLFTSSCG